MLGYFIGRFVLAQYAPNIENYDALGFNSLDNYLHAVGRTMAYVTLAWASVINIMNVRSFNKSLFTIGFTSNPLLFAGICFSLTLVTVTAAVPGVREIFHCVPLTLNHWLIMASLSATPFILVEIWKLFIRMNLKRRA
jgi:magnesium-transporting ATPase (P-type)